MPPPTALGAPLSETRPSWAASPLFPSRGYHAAPSPKPGIKRASAALIPWAGPHYTDWPLGPFALSARFVRLPRLMK